MCFFYDHQIFIITFLFFFFFSFKVSIIPKFFLYFHVQFHHNDYDQYAIFSTIYIHIKKKYPFNHSIPFYVIYIYIYVYHYYNYLRKHQHLHHFHHLVQPTYLQHLIISFQHFVQETIFQNYFHTYLDHHLEDEE